MGAEVPHLKDWRFSIDVENIGWAYFDREGESVNSLGQRPCEELSLIISHVENLAKEKKIRGLGILSGKDGHFIAGADIREFEGFKTEEIIKDAVIEMTSILDRIEALPVPVVVGVHGFCLGGGLELALACHYRIADRYDGTKFGFPEVKLGIYPGLNGAVRSLAKMGPLNAMNIMLTGRNLRPGAAKGMGLVDQLVKSKENLRWAVRKAILQKRKSKPLSMTKKLMLKGPARSFLASQMRKQTKAKVREDHYPAPFALIDWFEKYGGASVAIQKKQELEGFAPLMVSETSRNLRRVFHLSEDMKKIAPKDVPAPRKLHVIGAGTMGADIAAVGVISGMEVTLQDLSEEALEKAHKRAKKLFKKRLKKPVKVKNALKALRLDKEGKGIAGADVIIEAIVENLKIKQTLFKELETKARKDAVLATNTSSLPLEDISKPMKRPTRLVGIHFFNPVPQMPLVEIIKGEKTAKKEIDRAARFVTAISKFPLVVKSCLGFLVNRVLAPYMFEAQKQYESGISAENIDAAALKFGMPMGPMELMDVVGLDICKHVGVTLKLAKGTEDGELNRLVDAGKLGKKTGEGFYKWEKGKAQKEKSTYSHSQLDDLADTLLAPLFAEVQKCSKEKIAKNDDLIDAGVIFGTGFAPFRGGPLHYLKTKGKNLKTRQTSK